MGPDRTQFTHLKIIVTMHRSFSGALGCQKVPKHLVCVRSVTPAVPAGRQDARTLVSVLGKPMHDAVLRSTKENCNGQCQSSRTDRVVFLSGWRGLARKMGTADWKGGRVAGAWGVVNKRWLRWAHGACDTLVWPSSSPVPNLAEMRRRVRHFDQEKGPTVPLKPNSRINTVGTSTASTKEQRGRHPPSISPRIFASTAQRGGGGLTNVEQNIVKAKVNPHIDPPLHQASSRVQTAFTTQQCLTRLLLESLWR
jgi:hypothetical protein